MSCLICKRGSDMKIGTVSAENLSDKECFSPSLTPKRHLMYYESNMMVYMVSIYTHSNPSYIITSDVEYHMFGGYNQRCCHAPSQ